MKKYLPYLVIAIVIITMKQLNLFELLKIKEVK